MTTSAKRKMSASALVLAVCLVDSHLVSSETKTRYPPPVNVKILLLQNIL